MTKIKGIELAIDNSTLKERLSFIWRKAQIVAEKHEEQLSATLKELDERRATLEKAIGDDILVKSLLSDE